MCQLSASARRGVIVAPTGQAPARRPVSVGNRRSTDLHNIMAGGRTHQLVSTPSPRCCPCAPAHGVGNNQRDGSGHRETGPSVD